MLVSVFASLFVSLFASYPFSFPFSFSSRSPFPAHKSFEVKAASRPFRLHNRMPFSLPFHSPSRLPFGLPFGLPFRSLVRNPFRFHVRFPFRPTVVHACPKHMFNTIPSIKYVIVVRVLFGFPFRIPFRLHVGFPSGLPFRFPVRPTQLLKSKQPIAHAGPYHNYV